MVNCTLRTNPSPIHHTLYTNMITITFQDSTILAMEDDKVVGKIEFSLADGEMSILHTYAYESGRGIGKMLMQAVVEWAAEHQYTIRPICSFAQKYLEGK